MISLGNKDEEDEDQQCTQFNNVVIDKNNESQRRELSQNQIHKLTNPLGGSVQSMEEGECQQNADDVSVNQTQNTSCNHEAGVQTESPYFYQSEGFGSLDVHFNSSSNPDDIQMDISAASTSASASDENVKEDAQLFIPIKRRKRKIPTDEKTATQQVMQVQEQQTQLENIELLRIEQNTNNFNQNDKNIKECENNQEQTTMENKNTNLEQNDGEGCLLKVISKKSRIIIKFTEQIGNDLKEVQFNLNKGDSIELVSLVTEQVSIDDVNNYNLIQTNIDNQLKISEINNLDDKQTDTEQINDKNNLKKNYVENQSNILSEINKLIESEETSSIMLANNNNVIAPTPTTSVDATSTLHWTEFEFRRVRIKCLNCLTLCEHEFKKRIGKSKHRIVCSCNCNNFIKFNKDNQFDSIYKE